MSSLIDPNKAAKAVKALGKWVAQQEAEHVLSAADASQDVVGIISSYDEVIAVKREDYASTRAGAIEYAKAYQAASVELSELIISNHDPVTSGGGMETNLGLSFAKAAAEEAAIKITVTAREFGATCAR